MNPVVVLFVLLLVLMLGGVPVSWSLCISCVAAIVVDGVLPLSVVAQRLFAGSNSFATLAVPAFILAGEIMSRGGIAKRMIEFAEQIVGKVRGGLAPVSIIASAFFAALTGSALATTAAIGGIMYPEMKKRDYPLDFSAAVQAIGGTLGPVIPPSLLFIYYSTSTGASFTKLLMSGVVTGIVSAICLCAMSLIIAEIKKMPKSDITFSLKGLVKSFLKAILALLTPVIILGGIYTGQFTPTESASIAVLYSLLISVFVFKALPIRDVPKVFIESAKSTANMIFLIMSAMLFGYLIAYFKVTSVVQTVLATVIVTKWQFLLFVILILLICGMFMEAASSIVILAPMLAPVAASYNIDPIHFGFLVVFTLSIGIATPPFGPSTFVACTLSERPFAKVAKNVLPFIGMQTVLAILFAFVPWFSTWLPNMMGR